MLLALAFALELAMMLLVLAHGDVSAEHLDVPAVPLPSALL